MCSLLSVPVTTATPRCSDHLSTTCGLAGRVSHAREAQARAKHSGLGW
jgi:hypothetical protein